MWYTKQEAELKFPGARFGDNAWVGDNAVVGYNAWVGKAIFILVICSKYNCNIIPYEDRIEIRIGCESHTIEDWELLKEELADKHDREWWDAAGSRVYEFLKGEVVAYQRKKEG